MNKDLPTASTTVATSQLPLDKIKQIFDNHDTEWVSVASLDHSGNFYKLILILGHMVLKKLGDLVKAYPKIFDVTERSTNSNEHKNLYVRLKQNNCYIVK